MYHMIPQGAIPGPQLFIIYINDLSPYELRMYADDTILTISHSDEYILEQQMNDDLREI